jgi:hypothetical protein
MAKSWDGQQTYLRSSKETAYSKGVRFQHSEYGKLTTASTVSVSIIQQYMIRKSFLIKNIDLSNLTWYNGVQFDNDAT